MMNREACQEYAALLVDYSDEELADADRQRVEAHLTECDNCREELSRLQESLSLACTLWQEEGAAADRVAMVAGGCCIPHAPREGTVTRSVTSTGMRSLAVACGVCAAAVLLAAGVWLVWPAPGREEAALRATADAPREATGQTAQGPTRRPPDELDIETIIAREATAARLRATIDLLAEEPSLQSYREDLQRDLATAYADTHAGSRPAPPPPPLRTRSPSHEM